MTRFANKKNIRFLSLVSFAQENGVANENSVSEKVNGASEHKKIEVS